MKDGHSGRAEREIESMLEAFRFEEKTDHQMDELASLIQQNLVVPIPLCPSFMGDFVLASFYGQTTINLQ